MPDSAFSDLLTQTCTIRSRSLGAVDTWGVPAETITDESTSVACLVQPAPEKLEIERRGKKLIADYLGFFEYSQVIDEDDIVVQGSISYVVLSIENAAGQEHHKEIYLRKVVA